MEAFELLTYKGAREVYETLRAYPHRQFSISELSRMAKQPFGTTYRMVRIFERAQIVDLTLVGRTQAVKFLKDTPFSKMVGQILKTSKSQQQLTLPELKRILKAKEPVKEAHLFGSVAIGKEKLESDIDVALLVSQRIDITSFTSSLYDKYGAKVIPLTFTSKEEFDDFLSGKKTVRLK